MTWMVSTRITAVLVKDDAKGWVAFCGDDELWEGRCQNSLATGVAAGPKPERAASHPLKL
jgi:hypothetical protein